MYRNFLVILLALWVAGCASVPAGIVVDTPPQAMPLQSRVFDKRPVIAFALGGGATRGFAHIGVLNALEQNGIVPDIVVGTSAGAVTGVLFAGNIRGAKLEEVAKQLHRDQVVDWSYSGRGFIRGELLQKYIDNLLENRRIEELPTMFAATATDLSSGKLVVFTEGEPGLAIRASSVIPGLVSPVNINGHDYVDGGLVSKIPVQTAKQLGADIVIAVDVSRTPEEHLALNSTLSVMEQAVAIMSQTIVAHDLRNADLVIRPEIGVIPLGDFDLKTETIRAGERAAAAAIPAINRLLEKWRNAATKDIKTVN